MRHQRPASQLHRFPGVTCWTRQTGLASDSSPQSCTGRIGDYQVRLPRIGVSKQAAQLKMWETDAVSHIACV